MALKLASIVGIKFGYLVISSDPRTGTDTEEYFPDLDAAISRIGDAVRDAERVIEEAKNIPSLPATEASIVSPRDFAKQLQGKARR